MEASFPIVGIGASAGGLEALGGFFKAMPAESGMAFVLVVHLDPSHTSLLPELLQKYTKMCVRQIKDGMKAESDQVYVIPPNKDLTILNGALQLMERGERRADHLPIDSFLRSLAKDQGRNATCIILSGTGTDGTLGVKAIKGETGMVMVQDEGTAKFDGMPRSAIATGLADYVLPPQEMPNQLIRYAAHPTGNRAQRMIEGGGEIQNALQKIFVVLRARTNHDFSLYKKNTICRRIERRMNVHQLDDISAYLRYLTENDHEVNILYKELLIGVTNFFRDADAFDILKSRVLPHLFHSKPEDYTLRVWVPGCSSGEEAYSIAILMNEWMVDTKQHFNIQIFGTDIDEEAIVQARSGLYPVGILADVGSDRLERYFMKEEDGYYRIKKSIREMLVFAPQNVIRDPPFTKLDLISCRNLMIYLGPELQKRVLSIFHYSLKTNGILFLGSSETVGQATDLFSPIHKKVKIYQCKPSENTSNSVLAIPAAWTDKKELDKRVDDRARKTEELGVLQLAEAILQQSHIPPCAIIDHACNVIYIHGRTGRFLEPAEGKVTTNILEMARPGLKAEMAAAIRRVGLHKQEVLCRDLQIETSGDTILLDVSVKPVLGPGALHGLMMVVFKEIAPSFTKKADGPEPGTDNGQGGTLKELQLELQHTKENLLTMIEELETSNEELQSTNEELQSTNEELQSTNEELETSKEELQSLNEESATVNEELQIRIDEVTRTNDDLKNLLDSTQLATIFLDMDLCVRRFTPKASELIPLAVTDLGRPVTHFATRLVDMDLAEVSEAVLKDLVAREIEVRSRDGLILQMRAHPYRTENNMVDGVVITFDDITRIKLQSDETVLRLATILKDSNDAITLQDQNGRILAWNLGAEKMYGYTEAEALTMSTEKLIPVDMREEMSNFNRKLFSGEKIESYRTSRLAKDGSILEVWLTLTVLMDETGSIVALATTERDMTKMPAGS